MTALNTILNDLNGPGAPRCGVLTVAVQQASGACVSWGCPA